MFDQRAMRDMMKQAQQMQAQMEKAQPALAEETVALAHSALAPSSSGFGVPVTTLSTYAIDRSGYAVSPTSTRPTAPPI